MKRMCILVLAAAACGANPDNTKFGSLDVTTSAPTIEQPLTTSDGWTVKFDRFLVHVSSVSVAGLDHVVTASATGQIVDQVAPPPKSLVSATNRIARAWQDVSFAIGPVLADGGTVPLAPATDADAMMMQAGGLSFYIEGSLTKDVVVKTLRWGFTTSTLYTGCAGVLGGVRVPGMVVPPDGNDTADVVMGGDVLFSDDLAAPGALLRADAIAAADADADGVVTVDELRATALDTLRRTGATYGVGPKPEVVDLGAYIEELTRATVRSYRAEGACTVAAAPTAP